MNYFEKITVSDKYKKLINGLHKNKISINSDKIKKLGYIDVDDHGFILHPDFNFTAEPNHKDGYIYGSKAIGETFRKYLNESPKYINANSALAGCWVGYLQNWVKIDIIPEDRPLHLEKIWNRYNIWQSGFGAMNHFGPDMNIGLELGWAGLLNKVRHYRAKNNPTDTSFYDGEELLLLGIKQWITNHANYAEDLAETEQDSFKRNNYIEIAKINRWLIDNPPRTLRESCQFLAHFQVFDRTYFAGGALSQLDEILKPYYDRDIKNGILTDDMAIWYISSLFFNDTHYSQIAGLKADGSGDVTSKMSYIILEAMHQIKIPVNIALRVHDDVDDELLRRSLEYNLADGTGVDYSLNIGCEEGYSKNGFPIQAARLRAKVGCNWTALPGTEYPMQDVTRCNMATALVESLGDLKTLTTRDLDTLWDKFTYHLKIMLDSIKDGFDCHYEVISRNKPEIVLNLFMHGPIERGLNVAEGGVDNISFCIDGIALATVADSFAAIELRVVNEKNLTWDKLLHVLDVNYENEENIRLMLKNIDRFGSPGSLSEKWALKIRDFFVDYSKIPTTKHQLRIIPGMFSHGDVYAYGKSLSATPNGRFDKDPISHSNDPDPGFARGINSFSPSLKATAVAKTQPGLGNSAPLHLDIDSNLVESEGGIEALMALIKTHNHMGGTLINLNCITKERLMQAHEDPSKHPDLVIRVTGYSAFFSSLSKEYRQQVIDRFLSE
ncbi:MAG: hypothetical protein OCD02_07550 [Spirochaetaceae bacterium]